MLCWPSFSRLTHLADSPCHVFCVPPLFFLFWHPSELPALLSFPTRRSSDLGAGVGAAAQHSQTLYGMFGAIPGVKVVVPSNPYDAKGLMLAAVEEDNLVVFSEDKAIYGIKGEVPEEYYTVEIGKAK